MHAFVQEESTYVRDGSHDVLVGDLFLLPPILCVLELLVADAEFARLFKVLANVEST